jgi:beta-galactosidase/beta-glucuronidase
LHRSKISCTLFLMSSPLLYGLDTDPSRGHPFPQLRRAAWARLSGTWGFEFDDENCGLSDRWFARNSFSRSIVVPFPPESSASTIGDAGYHPVVWYVRELTAEDFATAGRGQQGDRVILHFGAVDYASMVWLNGVLVCSHVGGHTPFSADVSDYLRESGNILVVRAEDDPADVGKPRGKQEWLEKSRDIWYDRTTGIWQTVWLEAVPALHVTEVAWIPNRNTDAIRLELQLARVPSVTAILEVQLRYEGVVIAQQSVTLDGSTSPSMTVELRGQLNGQHYDKLLWSPENPRLIEAQIAIVHGASRDVFDSYLGLRTVGTGCGRFVLNDRPYYVRSVLSQGFWPDTHLASPDDDALRNEVQLIKSLGFNAARIHQKFEDPRFLFWADRLGLLVWSEAPAAYEFTANAMTRLVTEWIETVRRDRSHPCIVTWVPLNESWGIQHISAEPAQRAFSRAMADLTRALDPSRPVISNDGWEHT